MTKSKCKNNFEKLNDLAYLNLPGLENFLLHSSQVWACPELNVPEGESQIKIEIKIEIVLELKIETMPEGESAD